MISGVGRVFTWGYGSSGKEGMVIPKITCTLHNQETWKDAYGDGEVERYSERYRD